MSNYNIKVMTECDGILKINSQTAKELNLDRIKNSVLRFGLRVSEIHILVDESIEIEDLFISKNVIDFLMIPYDCTYNISVKNNELLIGPFIGIFIGNKEQGIVKRMKLLNSFVKKYSQINGTIFAFTMEGINKSEFIIDGYFFNENLNLWMKKKLPFPMSIFNRFTMSKKQREFFRSIYGDKIFNPKAINKWEMYEQLVQYPETKELLPETIQYTNSKDIIDMLNKHNTVYIKPISGKQGVGIFKVEKLENFYLVKTRENQENVEWSLRDERDLDKFMKVKLNNGNYIIQESLNIQLDKKSIDFRVGMDKDQSGEWKRTMFVSRISGTESIISNRAAGGGEVRTIEDVLKNEYKMDKQMVNRYKEYLVSKSKLISKKLEMTGLNMGKLAFDLAIDINKKVWLIEINTRYPDDTLANAIDKEIVSEIRLKNMLYAKLLSGFKDERNDYKFNFDEKNIMLKDSKIKKRIRIYVSIPIKSRKKYREYVMNCSEQLGLVGKIENNITTKKIVIEVEGQSNKIDRFIKLIKVYDGINALGLEAMNEFKLEKGFKNVINKNK